MSRKNRIECDRKGRPIPPGDIPWQKGMTRAVVLLAVGVVLLPAGLLLFSLVPLPDGMAVVKLLFGFLIFVGALFIIYGIVIAALAQSQRRKMPSAEKLEAALAERGEHCAADVVSVRTRTKNGETHYRITLEYEDKRYQYTRRFDGGWDNKISFEVGDVVDVYYLPDSNILYVVDFSGEKTASRA